jgi:hypothetical protein
MDENERFTKTCSNRLAATFLPGPGRTPLFLEKALESVLRIVGVARRAGKDASAGRTIPVAVGTRRRSVARNRDSGRKQGTIVLLIFYGDSKGDRLHALKPCRRLEMRTLLTTMEHGSAFRAVIQEIGAGCQHGGTAKTSRPGYVLHEPGESGAGDVDRGARALRFGALALAVVALPAFTFLIAAL